MAQFWVPILLDPIQPVSRASIAQIPWQAVQEEEEHARNGLTIQGPRCQCGVTVLRQLTFMH